MISVTYCITRKKSEKNTCLGQAKKDGHLPLCCLLANEKGAAETYAVNDSRSFGKFDIMIFPLLLKMKRN